ncbi:MAG: hypothetical protein H7833_10090 [Magnetococcus sp. DMHC-1]|nr:hypothetical protein [Magnetococcales bacterium]
MDDNTRMVCDLHIFPAITMDDIRVAISLAVSAVLVEKNFVVEGLRLWE